MLRHKNIDRICCIVLAATLLLTCCFMGAAATGMITGERSLGYENRLFDQSRVHTIDIVMDDWEGFLETCTSEEYAACSVVIDGESFGNVAIRGKGNTSLSSVQSYGNDRYSFKVEFDHYQTGKTYYGLDKLSLNNLIQDKTYLKDYLAYTLMNKMGVAAPLCSFVQINVNGEPWGLYLAVEAVEDSFLSRNYGSDSGELYKPDSMSFGGGRGNGRDFDMDAFREQFENGDFELPQGIELPEEFDPAQMGNFNPMQMFGGDFDPSQFTEDFDHSRMMSTMQTETDDAEDSAGRRSRDFGGMGGGMGSSDVMLQYTDDDPDSYSNIFNNAKTDITEADQQRLIESLKQLSEGENIESVVDTDAVIRYLVVHNFLCNGDSYTGNMVHNYYLYEEDGELAMIPWDYNLAFGAFNMGGMSSGSGATSTVNSPIDSPVSSGDISSRPIISWIFESEEYTARYHELYAEFIETVFDSGWMAEELDRLSELLAPYVEAETRAFFTFEEFEAGVNELKEFCDLRAQSIAGQLDGSVPSTTEAQRANQDALIDASDVDLSAMGEFGMGGGRGGADMMQRGFSERIRTGKTAEEDATGGEEASEPTEGVQTQAVPAGGSANAAPAGGQMTPPEGFRSGMSMQQPGMSQAAQISENAEVSAAGQMTPPEGMGAMPGEGQMTPPEGMSGMATEGQMTPPEDADGESAQAEQSDDAHQGEATGEPTAEPEPEATQNTAEVQQPSDFQMPQMPGGASAGGSDGTGIWMLAGCAALLLAAILFAKFFRVNR